MSETPRKDADAPAPEPSDSKKADVAGSLFFRKLDRDVWEAWTWTAVGLGVSAAMIWLVALLKLGYISVYAWGVGIPLCMFMSVLIVLWGLVKSLLNPPIFRPSRSVGFVTLMAIALPSAYLQLPAPVSTGSWRSTHTYRLPFDGPWYTIAGGTEIDRNPLAISPSMRFAFEFTRLADNGGPYSGDQFELTSYPCFGSPVLAPTDMQIVRTVDDQADQPPQQGQRRERVRQPPDRARGRGGVSGGGLPQTGIDPTRGGRSGGCR